MHASAIFILFRGGTLAAARSAGARIKSSDGGKQSRSRAGTSSNSWIPVTVANVVSPVRSNYSQGSGVIISGRRTTPLARPVVRPSAGISLLLSQHSSDRHVYPLLRTAVNRRIGAASLGCAVENQRTLLIRTVEFYSFHFRVFNRYNLNHNHENSSSAALGRGDARVQLVPQVGQPRGQPCRRRLRGCRAPYVGASSSWRVASSRSRVCARRSCFLHFTHFSSVLLSLYLL